MARTRSIKPGFFDNDALGELTPLTRLLFIGLWCIADREGRLENRPKRIKKTLLGYDDVDVDGIAEMLKALHGAGFVYLYDGYIQIMNFGKHQNPHTKEAASEIPPPPYEGDSTRQAPDKHQTSTMLAPDKHQTSRSSRARVPITYYLLPITYYLLLIKHLRHLRMTATKILTLFGITILARLEKRQRKKHGRKPSRLNARKRLSLRSKPTPSTAKTMAGLSLTPPLG